MDIITWLLKKTNGIDINSLLCENKRLKEENGKNLSQIKLLQKDKEIANHTIEQIKEQLNTFESEFACEKANSERLMKLTKKQDEELQTIHNSETEIKKENLVLKTEAERLNNNLREKDNIIANLKDQVAESIKSLENERIKIKELETDIKEKEKELEHNSQRTSNLEVISEPTVNNGEILPFFSPNASEDNEILDQIDLLKHSNEQLLKKNARLKKETDELRGKLANKENTIVILNERIKDLEAKEGIKPIDIIEDSTNKFQVTNLSKHNGYIDTTKRTIDTVVDLETGKEIFAKEFFSQPERVIFSMRNELQKAIYLRQPRFICKYCGQMVKISGRKTERGTPSFFSHLRDSEDCDYKTTTGRTKREIEREKYSKCNEGERHKIIKNLLAICLLKTRGVTNVRTEKTMLGNHPILNWRRPDVAISYRGQEIIFELQLSSTFVSVITERDLFYRLNKKFIIWVFNFDDQSEHVNLTNMVVKDVYYNHKLNIFIFDKAAYEESLKRGELILKCNWIKPDGSWAYTNKNASNEIGGEYVSLNDLTYSDEYKPYYKDAETEFFKENPNFAQRIISIEEENKQILADLDKRVKEEEETLQNFNKRLDELKEAFEIESEIKHSQKYLIGRQYGKAGLITFDGEIKIPFEYNSIGAHRYWIEAKNNKTVALYNKNNYEIINEGLKCESIGEGVYRIAKYVGEDILWGILDKRGENLVDVQFSRLEVWNAEKQYLLVVKNGKYGVMNQHGAYLLKCKYDYIDYIDSEGFAAVTLEGKTGKIDSECHFVTENSIAIEDKYKKICIMGKWGIENVVDCKYDELGSYRGNLLGIIGDSMKLIEVSFEEDCPVKVKFIGKNERGMLIFKVGSKEALMNVRQQQKARKIKVIPREATEMYISFTIIERNLLYLSATPVKGPVSKKSVETKDTDFALGTVIEGSIVRVDRNYIIIKSDYEQAAYIHRFTWGDYSMDQFNKGQMVKVEKIGFDGRHKKHIWKILSVS